jgi:hypothetical protein
MVFTPFAGVKSGGINEDELGILHRRDGEFGFVDGGDAVADRNSLDRSCNMTIARLRTRWRSASGMVMALKRSKD